MKRPYPLDENLYITLPDEWLGSHAMRYEKAREKASDYDMPGLLKDFILVVSILDDWNIPGMPANPDAWDVSQVPIKVMAWARKIALDSYRDAFAIPKKKSEPFPNGQQEAEMIKADGILATG